MSDETTHPCGACDEPVPEHQEFCTQCGTRQPAVADAQPDVVAAPLDATAADLTTPAMDVGALEAQAAELVGLWVSFRSFGPRGRQLRAEPDPDVAALPSIVIGRCRAIEARGAWVLLEHSSGTRGWCPVTDVKPRRSLPTDVSNSSVHANPALATVEALERLHALHGAGGLTDDEFAQAKRTLLR